MILTLYPSLQEYYKEIPEKIIETIGKSLVLYYIDHEKRAIWTHIGLVTIICDEFDIPCPREARTKFFDSYHKEENLPNSHMLLYISHLLNQECHRLLALKPKKVLSRACLDVIHSVIRTELFLLSSK